MPPKNTPKMKLNVEKCDVCDKPLLNTKYLQCNICKLYHHQHCLSYMSVTAYEAVELVIKETQYSAWSCRKCSHVYENISARVEENAARIKVIENNMIEIKTGLKNDTEEINKNLNLFDVKMSETSEGIYDEYKLREDKKLNVLLFGINDDDNKLDKSLIIKLCDKLNISDLPNKIKYCRRLGAKKEGTMRPLLIGFNNQYDRDIFLEARKRLDRNDQIRLKPDLTIMQRKDDKKFRDNTEDLNKNKLVDNIGLFKWTVVGPPGRLRRIKTRNINQSSLNNTYNKIGNFLDVFRRKDHT